MNFYRNSNFSDFIFSDIDVKSIYYLLSQYLVIIKYFTFQPGFVHKKLNLPEKDLELHHIHYQLQL